MDWLVQTNVSEKRIVSIFRSEVNNSVLKMETACFFETLASTNQSTRVRIQKNIIGIVIAVKTLNFTLRSSLA
jgi:hypothetical protein